MMKIPLKKFRIFWFFRGICPTFCPIDYVRMMNIEISMVAFFDAGLKNKNVDGRDVNEKSM